MTPAALFPSWYKWGLWGVKKLSNWLDLWALCLAVMPTAHLGNHSPSVFLLTAWFSSREHLLGGEGGVRIRPRPCSVTLKLLEWRTSFETHFRELFVYRWRREVMYSVFCFQLWESTISTCTIYSFCILRQIYLLTFSLIFSVSATLNAYAKCTCLGFLRQSSLCVQAGFELLTSLLPQSSKSWDKLDQSANC